MGPLDIMLIIFCILSSAMVVFLIIVIKKLIESVDKLNGIIDENTNNINEIVSNIATITKHNTENINLIVNNLEAITADTKIITSRVSGTISGIEEAIGVPITKSNISSSVMGVKKTLGYGKYAFLGANILSGILASKKAKKNKKNKKGKH